MSFQTEGIEQLKLKLMRARDLPAEATIELKELAKETQTLAINMAPIEYGDLKDAIRIREVAGQGAKGRFEKGLRNFEVYVNNDHPVSSEREARSGITTVGEYAWFVHEYMGWGNTPGAPNKNGRPFMPSAASVAAGEAHGVEAGGKFLERAGIEVGDQMEARIGKMVLKFWQSLDI